MLLIVGMTRSEGLFDLSGIVPNPDYDAILADQPAGLRLTMTLPKDHFYQGEKIAATLTYSNTGKDSYAALIMRGDRSGRVQDVRFFGQDEHGAPVADPIGWIYMRGISGGGPTQSKELKDGSSAENTLIINQWLRFDHPGTYTIFAEAANVRTETVTATNYDKSAHLVSNKFTITITPLPPDQEKTIVDDALLQIVAAYDRHDDPKLTHAANEDKAHTMAYSAVPAIETLRYLQTPLARAALRSRLDKTPEYMLAGGHFEMDAALLGAPDRPKEAQFILDDVQAGRLKVDNSLIGLYAQLKSYPQFMEQMAWERWTLTPAQIPQRQAIDAAWDKAEKNAEKEILAAATAASSKTGVSDLDLIWSAFLTNPYDADFRAPVVTHQLDFSHDRQLQLLRLVETCFCGHMAPPGKNYTPDFLPLVRLYLGSPAYNRNALMILSYARPDEAHAITLADWASPIHHYFNYDAHFDEDAPMGQLAVTLLENPRIKWTGEQKEILDQMRKH